MFWFLLIIAITCTLSWIGFNTLWSLGFAIITWFVNYNNDDFTGWLLLQAMWLLGLFLNWIRRTSSCCCCEYTFKKPELTPEQKREHNRNVRISLSMLWGVIFIWRLCTLLF